ncbi:MAG: hypothetical protein ACXAE3_00945 [Candidatus Kariarchaeaceae archaeon]
MVNPLWFYLGAGINLIGTVIAVVVHKKHDGYSIMRTQLSYTGNRKIFRHHNYDRVFKRAYQPFWFNIGYTLSGIFLALGFLSIDNWVLRISGAVFGICISSIGIYDVGTNYKNHQLSLLISQISFLVATIALHIWYFHWSLLLASISVFFFMFWYLYTKISNTRDYNPDLITLPQRIFAILEIVFLFFIPFWVLGLS